MLVNADFSQRVIVSSRQYQWVASPQAGIERVMLDRAGEEKGRATSIVKYAPGSYFPRHVHAGGEEILVLAGVFSEGEEHYGAGWYLRNPPDSSHRPYSEEGATIFVKLHQMPPHEQCRVRINTRDASIWRRQGNNEICPLFSSEFEQVWLQYLAPYESMLVKSVTGTELLVLTGGLAVDDVAHEHGSWMRLPVGDELEVTAGKQGATLYIKTGHLRGALMGL
ncbi:cupin domain-containing protein [Methylobacillus sp.]|uniref:cupin domain-containing protein n=1 Tax=Methylobacillus sp. TaxID=56818 RepID=UPI002FE3F41B